MSKEIQIGLSNNEAIVLFEFLSRFSDKETLKIEDQSEARVLWDIQSKLENFLAEPFSENYPELLEKARKNVRDK
ncbi:hypothetical protein BH20ACI4_BH20ACI4_07650 [soil metagenome]